MKSSGEDKTGKAWAELFYRKSDPASYVRRKCVLEDLISNGKLLKGVVSALTESPSKPEEVHFLKPVKLSRTDMKIALTSLDQAQLYVLFKL